MPGQRWQFCTRFRKNPYIQNYRLVTREYITTTLFSISHLTGGIFTLKNEYPLEKY